MLYIIYSCNFKHSYEQGITTEEKKRHEGKQQVHCFGEKILRLDLKESTEGFFWRERGRSFHEEGQKTEKAQESTVESLMQGPAKLPLQPLFFVLLLLLLFFLQLYCPNRISPMKNLGCLP